MKNIGLIFILGLTLPVLAAPKAVKEKPKRKIAQDTPYVCKILYNFNKGPMETTIKLSGDAKFAGIESHEEITLSAKEGVKTLSRNSFFDHPGVPYIVDTFQCDDALNCEGFRVTHAKAGAKKVPYVISPLGAGVQGGPGKETVFHFSREKDGFSIRLADYVTIKEDFGMKITCRN